MSFVAILKFFNVFILASVKYVFSFPYALLIGLEYEEAIIAVLIGGIAGFFFFYYLSGVLIRKLQNHKICVCNLVPGFVKIRHKTFCKTPEKASQKNKFTRKNKMLVNLKAKYGLWGIIITAPIFLSIPLGAFLLNKYYSKKKNVFAYMMISIFGWTVFFSTVVIVFPNLV
ncbi:MAG: hypothetical protein HQ522_11820 [Bacteroidetes bacterium]|nr:hypothetical protein [Bacteroidota bacterium]